MKTLKLPAKIRVTNITTEQLCVTYKYNEVHGYCQYCNNYNMNYSCPDFSFDTRKYWEKYPYVTLILTELPTEELVNQWDLIKDKQFSSRVYDLHMRGKTDGEYDVISALSMFAFEQIKNVMADELLYIESLWSESISIPPGSCTRCKVCNKIEDKPCVYPEKLRYSLEALGFMVSDIYNKFFGIELEWSKNELPKAYHTCSALFTKQEVDFDKIMFELENENIGVVIDI